MLIALLAHPASALPPCDAQRAMVEAARLRPGATATLTARDSFCTGWFVLRFHDLGAGGTALTRERMERSGRVTRSRIDALSCPALAPALERLSTISVSPDFTRRLPVQPRGMAPPPPPPTDGTSYVLETRSVRGAGPWGGSFRLAQNHGTLADWAEKELPKLDGCWRDLPPSP